jgi:hypothetical protein
VEAILERLDDARSQVRLDAVQQERHNAGREQSNEQQSSRSPLDPSGR